MLRKPRALIAILGITGAVLAGCGSSSSLRSGATKTVAARQTPPMSSPDTGSSRAQSSHPAVALGQLPSHGTHAVRTGKSRITTAKVVAARQTPNSTRDDESPTGAKPLNPCTLVRLSEAQSITGGAITKMIDAPLGPTCIYSAARHAAGITLAVENENFNLVTRHLGARKQVVVSGRHSVCGRLGTQMLLVPLGHSQLLNVTAPCGIAKRFATLAVSRLSA